MRPLNKIKEGASKREDTLAKEFWKNAERKKEVEKIEEIVSFSLSEKEAKKCRYEVIDKNMRMVECTIHQGNFSHGIRMFPPINWEMIKGIPYYRKDKNSEWVRWYPTIKENLKRFEE